MGAPSLLGSGLLGAQTANRLLNEGQGRAAQDMARYYTSNNSLGNIGMSEAYTTGGAGLQSAIVYPNSRDRRVGDRLRRIGYRTGIWLPLQEDTTAEDIQKLMEQRYQEQMRRMEQVARQEQIQLLMAEIARMKGETAKKEAGVDPAEVRANGGKRAIEL